MNFQEKKFMYFIIKSGQSLAINLVVTRVTTLFNIVHITTYFKNLIVKLHIIYIFNTHIKF